MNTMHSIAASLVLAMACLCASAQEAEAPLGLDDFAYSMAIEPGTASPVQTVLIPPSVYQALVRSDLGDLRVFAADGSQVSHAMRRLDKDRTVTGKSLDLKLFPLTRSAAESPDDDLQIVVKRSDNGKVVSVSTQDNAPNDPTELRVVGIVADASGLEHPIQTLRFKLAPTDKSFELPIQIDTSDDLSSWSATRRKKTLSHLKNEDKLLEQLDVSVEGITEPYLRITWGDESPPTEITGIEAVLQDARVPADVQGIELEGTADPENPRRVLFDLGSNAVPVDRVTVIVPEKNTLLGGRLDTSDLPDGAYRTLHRGTFFQLVVDGTTDRNATVKLSRTNQRYWRLVADEKGAGFGASIPSLRVEYFPDQLIFLAKSSGPYTLAYGSSRAKPSSFTTREIFADFPAGLQDDLPVSSARLGPAVVRGGEAARIPPPLPEPSKLPTVLLWAILIGGVGVLIVFVWKLSADLRKPTDTRG